MLATIAKTSILIACFCSITGCEGGGNNNDDDMIINDRSGNTNRSGNSSGDANRAPTGDNVFNDDFNQSGQNRELNRDNVPGSNDNPESISGGSGGVGGIDDTGGGTGGRSIGGGGR